jgi:protocatechuate 3,4-dioxygenase beta subunit
VEGFLFSTASRAGVSAEILRPLSTALAETDDSGSFTFRTLLPGRYTLAVQREGYFAPYTGVPNPIVGRTITIEAGKRPAALDLFLVEGGMITGRIRDPLGQPAVGVTVMAYQPAYPNGVLSWTGAISRVTDDRGEYRLNWLRPGQYLVAAIPAARGANPGSPESWVRTFYPGSDYPLAAVPLAVKDGEEVRSIDIDIRTSDARTYRISGIAINPLPSLRPNPATGVVDRSLSGFYLLPHEPSLLDSEAFPTQIPNAIPAGSRPNGEFEIRNVKPGMYHLYTSYLDQSIGRYFTSRTLVDVRDEDVTGLSIVVGSGGTLDAQVVIEGLADPPIRLDSLELEFRTIDTTPRMFAAFNSSQSLDTAGKVILKNIAEARYRFSLRGLPPDAYIADIRQSGRSVFDEGVLLGGQLEPIRIAVRADGGTVTGFVERSGKGVPGATVILAPPADRRKNPQLFRTAVTGEDGGFSIRGVMPSAYTILALQSRPSGEPWLHSDFLARYIQRGRDVRVDARSASPVRLELITD